jgi:hypothetical protein
MLYGFASGTGSSHRARRRAAVSRGAGKCRWAANVGRKAREVGVVQTADYMNSLDSAFAVGHPRNRRLRSERLVRPGLVAEPHVLGHEMQQVRFAQDQNVVEKLSA